MTREPEPLTRYAMVGDLNSRHMEPRPDGDYVRWDDYRATLDAARSGATPDGLPSIAILLDAEDDGSWGIEVRLAEGQRLLTAGETPEDAIANAVESWPDELAFIAAATPPAAPDGLPTVEADWLTCHADHPPCDGKPHVGPVAAYDPDRGGPASWRFRRGGQSNG